MGTIQRPYGDSFLVSTPALDRVSQQLYLEQQQRRAEQRKQNEILDEQYARNIANIRDSDVPEYNQKYQEWRQSRQDLLRSKHLNGDEFIKRQMETNKKLGDVYAFGNKSKQGKDEEDQIAKDLMSHPDKYKDDAHNLLIYRRSVPISQLENNPLRDYNHFLYQGNTSKLQPVFEKARGQQKPVGEPTIDDTSDSLNHVITTFKGYNSPVDYYNSAASGIVGAKAHKDLLAMHDYTPDEEEKITRDYDAWRQKPEVIKAYGVNGTQLPSLDLTEEGRTLRLMAMEHALSHPLTADVTYKPKVKETFDYKEGVRQRNRLQLAALGDAYMRGRTEFAHSLSQADKATADLWIDDFVTNKVDEARTNGNKRNLSLDGNNIRGVEVPLDETLAQSLGFSDKTKGELLVDDNGNFYKLPYQTDETYTPLKDKSGQGFMVDKTQIRKLSPDELKLALGKKAAGVKQTNKEMSNGQRSYNYKGKTYTQEQIEKGAKHYGISTQEYLKQLGIK